MWWSVWPVFGRMREKQLPVPCRGMISEAGSAGGFKPDVRPGLKVTVKQSSPSCSHTQRRCYFLHLKHLSVNRASLSACVLGSPSQLPEEVKTELMSLVLFLQPRFTGKTCGDISAKYYVALRTFKVKSPVSLRVHSVLFRTDEREIWQHIMMLICASHGSSAIELF